MDESRIRFSEPARHMHVSYPRVIHSRSASEPSYISSARLLSQSHMELSLSSVPAAVADLGAVDNIRYACSVTTADGKKFAAYKYSAGIHKGMVVSLRDAITLSPKCKISQASIWDSHSLDRAGRVEKDGVVRTLIVNGGRKIHIYSKDVATKRVHFAAMRLDSRDDRTTYLTLVALHSIQQSWPSIRGFVSKDQLSAINNLSPRAWDSKRLQKRGATYSPKVDGERAYILLYQGMAHMFSKGKGYMHIGWRALEKTHNTDKPIVIDVENTLSYGCFFIDMLTDRNGDPSPKIRGYSWSLDEMMWLRKQLGVSFVAFKHHYATLKEAELACSTSVYPTDGVVALWHGSTTARKMKQERSVELLVREGGELVTSDGDTVIETAQLPTGVEPGNVVEIRFKLNRDGKTITSKPLFRRTDKISANSTSAVFGVLESFSCVSRSDETRRRNVTLWCDSLKSSLVKEAVGRCGDKKIVLDIGSGSGQSLDSLTSTRGVSYILVEPDEKKCAQLVRRAGANKTWTDPRDILSNMRGLKSGSQTYMVLCCELEKIVSDEQLMTSISMEIGAAIATFSAHFVVADLYDLSTYWSIPVVGCFYPYDGVETSKYLVNTLGIEMKRETDARCTVKWGGDQQYVEPYTVTSEYQAFSHVTKATDLLQAPGPELDEDVFNVCSKVHIIM